MVKKKVRKKSSSKVKKFKLGRLEINANRSTYTILSIIILILAGVVVSGVWSNPSVSHNAANIKVTIGGVDYSLKEAIDNGLIGGGSGSSTFTGLTDTPSSLIANKYFRVNSGGTALELIDISPGSDTTCATSGTCTQVCVGTDCRTAWPSGTGSSLWTQIGSDIYYTGDIEVRGNDIQSGSWGTDSKRARIHLDVKQLTNKCEWDFNYLPNGRCQAVPIAYPICDAGEVSGDTTLVDLSAGCADQTEEVCENTDAHRTYISCFELQIV